MNTNLPQNTEDQEIDLNQISKKIGSFFNGINISIFRAIQFIVKNAILLLVLLILGFGIGMYLDKIKKSYDSEIIVTPNFGSVDYLYSKIELIQSKINEGDTIFLKEVVGVNNSKKLKKISIKPINDVYKFIENKTENFELIKLMAEDGDINKIIENNLTSKNYTFHKISIKTNKIINNKEVLDPILNYLNNSEYYLKLQKEVINNIKIKMVQNDSIILQINSVLNSFSDKVNSNKNNNQLIYYNENTQLNEILKTKESLIIEQGGNRVSLVGLDKIIKLNSNTLNIINTKMLNGKLKFVIPFLLILSYIVLIVFMRFYKKQLIIQKSC